MPPTQRYAGGHLAPLGTLFNETFEDLTGNLADYALAGLGLWIVVVPVSFVLSMAAVLGMYLVMMVGVVASIAGGVAAGEAAGDPDLGALIGGVGTLGSIGIAFLLMFGVIGMVSMCLAPFSASLMRGVAAHQRGEGKLEFKSVFSSIRQDMGSVCFILACTTIASMIGVCFCYVGALVPAVLFGFAPAMVAIHRAGAIDALRRCARGAMANPMQHLIFAAANLGVSLVAAYIPVIGMMFVMALQVRAYRSLYGDGAAPAEAERAPELALG